MNHEEYKTLRDKIKKEMESCEKQLDALHKQNSDCYKKFINDNKPFQENSFVEIITKTKSGKNRKQIGYLQRWCLDDNDTFLPCAWKVKQYDKKHDDWSGISHYYIDKHSWVEYHESNFVSVKQINPLPMHCCDTCAWLEMHKNRIHCGITIDGQEYEEDRQACDRYSYWTWSRDENNITHREQLIRDNGGECEGERKGRVLLGQILNGACKRGLL